MFTTFFLKIAFKSVRRETYSIFENYAINISEPDEFTHYTMPLLVTFLMNSCVGHFDEFMHWAFWWIHALGILMNSRIGHFLMYSCVGQFDKFTNWAFFDVFMRWEFFNDSRSFIGTLCYSIQQWIISSFSDLFFFTRNIAHRRFLHAIIQWHTYYLLSSATCCVYMTADCKLNESHNNNNNLELP